MKILVDTNVLLRRAQIASPHHQPALDSVQALVEADIDICLVPQVLYEYWVVATRPVSVNGLGMDLAGVEVALQALLRDFELLRDERGIFGRWHTLVTAHGVCGKAAHDTRLVAAMQKHGFGFIRAKTMPRSFDCYVPFVASVPIPRFCFSTGHILLRFCIITDTQ